MAEKKLARYNAKRDFKKTAEPAGKVSKTRSGFSYLVQKHAATRLHYDFRLELDGVLKSWAVTRGPSVDPQDRRLAVEVEDHPVAYGDFEGVIPKGEYGGGTVMLWDQGTWEPLGDPRKDLNNGSLHFKLHGTRLKGEWTLVRMKDRPKDRGRHNWLLIKRTDKYARPGEGEKFLEKHATSVVSKRRMEAIARDADRTWRSKPKSTVVKETKKKKVPAFVPPELATLTTAMPTGKEWVHEVKFDGYRVLTRIENGKVTMLTRRGLDWTDKFGDLPKKLARLPVKSALLDGEVVALDKEKISSFSQLKNALSEGGTDLSYYLFDLLYANGENLIPLPLIERKARLKKLLAGKSYAPVFYSEHFTSTDDSFFQQACSLRLEGVISKRADAPYRSGRGKDWLKTKCHKRQEFVIGGYTPSTTGLPVIGSLLLGYYEGDDFVYAGRVGTGFDHKTAAALYKMLKKLKRKTMVYTKFSDAGRRGPGWKRGVFWVEPKLVCEVEFTEWTEDGALRHPSFQGLREDKPARDITRDIPIPLRDVEAKTMRKKLKKEEVAFSHPDKILFPDTGFTKQDLADYYTQVAEWMLLHIAGRPLSLVRCPEGSTKPCFFQRHAGQGLSAHVEPVPLPGDKQPYLMVHDLAGVHALVQMGVLEIHAWGSHAKTWDKPDVMVFDFDPDPGLPFAKVKEAAKEMRARLAEVKLQSFLKTTGGKGLHVVVPFSPQYGWDEVKKFTRRMASAMADDSPQHYTINIRKAERKGRIFIDYLRNGVGATAIAPYSSRARAGAPVAVPLAWAELPRLKAGNLWTIKTLPKRLAALAEDPWDDFFAVKQKLQGIL